MKKLLVFALSLMVFASCSSAEKSGPREAAACLNDEEMPAPATEQSVAPPPTPAVESRKMIATGNVEIKVKPENVDSIYENINALISKYKGYKSSEKQTEYRYSVSASIPSGSFNEFTDALSNVGGQLKDKSVQVVDVTDSYRDMVSSIKSKEAALEQYRLLLKKATKISEIIEIQSKIDEIQEALDRYNGRKLDVDRKVAYSDVNIQLIIAKKNVAADDDEPSFFAQIGEAMGDGLYVLEFLVLLIFRLWPLFIIGFAVFFIYKRRKKSQSK